ncbi:hypothetical protein [Flagellimonas iocasae]|uniref:WD40-like Beta Propeller Repeat n=1 Tax=Flagellimonas iocasae TaxID=2055905 RepID=A0ABW4XU23_9FLAO
MKIKYIMLIFGLMMVFPGCKRKVHYLDENYPGPSPKLYAAGIINVDGRYQQNLTMSPDGREHLFTQTDSAIWRYERILRIKNVDDTSVVLDTPQFVKEFKYENFWFIGEPMISPDNQDLYFVADYPPNFWNSKRMKNGDWSEPKKMDSLSSNSRDWFMSVSRKNTLFFATTYLPDPENPSLEMNGRIFESASINGSHFTKNMVNGPFNKDDAGDPVISPNEDYMVFGSVRDGGHGKADLYVTFKDGDGNWSEAFNLGDEINTVHWESGPYISPDERFLFFSRRDSSGVNARFSNIYWVSMEVVKNLRRNKL